MADFLSQQFGPVTAPKRKLQPSGPDLGPSREMFSPELLDPSLVETPTPTPRPGFGQQLLSVFEQMAPALEQMGTSMMSPEDRESFYDRKFKLEEVKTAKAREEQRQLEVEQKAQTQREQFAQQQRVRDLEAAGRTGDRALKFAESLYQRQNQIPITSLIEMQKGEALTENEKRMWGKATVSPEVALRSLVGPDNPIGHIQEFFNAQKVLEAKKDPKASPQAISSRAFKTTREGMLPTQAQKVGVGTYEEYMGFRQQGAYQTGVGGARGRLGMGPGFEPSEKILDQYAVAWAKGETINPLMMSRAVEQGIKKGYIKLTGTSKTEWADLLVSEGLIGKTRTAIKEYTLAVEARDVDRILRGWQVIGRHRQAIAAKLSKASGESGRLTDLDIQRALENIPSPPVIIGTEFLFDSAQVMAILDNAVDNFAIVKDNFLLGHSRIPRTSDIGKRTIPTEEKPAGAAPVSVQSLIDKHGPQSVQ